MDTRGGRTWPFLRNRTVPTTVSNLMTTHANGDGSDGLGEWDVETLVERLAADEIGGDVLEIEGVNASTVQRQFVEVQRRLESGGSLALCLDPTGGRAGCATIRELVTDYARRVQQRRQLDPATDELVDFLASSRDRSNSPYSDSLSARAFKNAICRLWKSLSRRVPAALFVFHLDECPQTEREILEHLIAEFFSDPVAEFAPELEQPGRVRSTVVFVDGIEGLDLEVGEGRLERLDVSEPVRESVRELLASDNVVDQFLASTGGDPTQMDALLSSLPADCQNFWLHRYRQLDVPEQVVVDLLALARQPLSVECLEAAVERIDGGVDFSSTVRWLTDEGFVSREIDSGTVRLQLEDGDFRRVLREELASSRRADLHRALAESACEAQLQDLGDRFLARHFLEAGDIDRGFEFGLRAARRLHGEHSLSEARELFETLLAHASEASETREIRSYLLDIHDALGNFEQAVDQVRALSESTDSERELDRLACKEAELYVRTGDYERAEQNFEPIYDGDDGSEHESLRAAALFGHAESNYLQGEHAEAESLVTDVIETIEPGEAETGTGDIETDRALVRARNLQGKLALFEGKLEEAESLFSSNYALARRRGFEREISRAELNMAVVDLQRGDYGSALETLEDLRSRSPGPEGAQRAVLLINLGMAAQHDGDYEEALEHYRSALREAKRADYDEALGMAAYNLATALADLGAYDRLLEILDRLEQRQLAGRHLFAGELPETLRAKAFIDRGEPARALEELGKLDRDDQERVSAGAWADAVFSSVHAHLELDQTDHARELLEEFEIPDETSVRDCPEGFKQSGWAAVHFEEGNYEKAAEAAKVASENLRDVGFFTERARTTVTRARSLMELGREGEAAALVDRRVTEFQERAETVPEPFEETFYQIPAYADLVELGRRVSNDTPAPYREYVEVDGDEEPETPDRRTEAFRRWRSRYSEIIGEDERLLKVFRRIDQVADSDSPVLIRGESGTGKELIAEAIHTHGTETGENGDEEPFVKVNCGAFVDNLLLSELFGHEKGAFTGAVEQKIGRFERADGGTIFLDEIGEVSQKAQIALLRVLQEGEFERVGGTDTKTVDVRIVCATNRDLETMVERGEFRLDLYYRLKGVLLELPPLRERRQDIPRLVRHFAAEQVEENRSVSFSREVLEFLASYSWPGNVRELKNFIRSILLFVEGDDVEMEHLRGLRDFFSEGDIELEAPEIDYDIPVDDYDIETPEPDDIVEDPEEALVEEIVADGLDLSDLKKRIEHQSIRRALKETGGNITRAAEILKMTRPRLSQIVNSDDRLVELKERLVG